MTSPTQWVKFFEDASLPTPIAKEYAVTFSDNRISMEMLGDLNKDYLKDMGITKTGDIIQILKHAKLKESRLAADKALQPEKKVAEIETKVIPTKVTVAPNANSTKSTVTTSTTTTKSKLVSGATFKSISKPAPDRTAVIVPAEPAVSQRLGPPVTKSFQPKAPVEEKRGVFDRLGGTTNEAKVSESQAKSAFSRLGSVSDDSEDSEIDKKFQLKKISDGIHPRLISEVPLSSATRTNKPLDSLKRKSETISAADRYFSDSSNDSNDIVPKNPVPKKKRLVLVRTLPDGTQQKNIISPDDPILKRVKVTKTLVPSRSASELQIVRRELSSKPASTSFSTLRTQSSSSLMSKKTTNFRADMYDNGLGSLPVKNRVSLTASPEVSRPGHSSSSSKPTHAATTGIKSRLALRPDQVESEKEKKSLKRISPPRADSSYPDRPVLVKHRLGGNRSDEYGVRTERTPQRKQITGPESDRHTQHRSNIRDRLKSGAKL